MKRGEITAMLSLIFVLLVSFIAAMLESAVIQVSKSQKRLDVDSAIFSVFGEYQKQLLEEYEILAVEGSYESGTFDESRLTGRMHYYGTGNIEHQITELQLLTDNKGQVFREQVIAYMEDVYGISAIQELTGRAQMWEEQQIQGQDAKQEQDNLTGELQDTLGQSGQELPETENPVAHIEELQKSGLLKLVLPKEYVLSSKSVDANEQVSLRELKSGRGSFLTRQNVDGMEGRLLFQEYILKRFESAVQEEETKNAAKDSSENRNLEYETEYIIEGKESDEQNLEAVVKKLMLARLGINYIFLQTDTEKQAEAETLAVALSALVLLPEAAEIVKQALLAAWAFGESVMDLRTLMSGKKVPLLKNAENWQLSLSALLKLGTEEDTQEGADSEEGLSYKDYLRILLFTEDSDIMNMRTLDRVEQNLIYEKGLDFFRADQCVTKVKIQNKAIIREGLTYDFPVYFGYE